MDDWTLVIAGIIWVGVGLAYGAVMLGIGHQWGERAALRTQEDRLRTARVEGYLAGWNDATGLVERYGPLIEPDE